jgi:dihydrofolate synthase/folylpolyglutamate synthase
MTTAEALAFWYRRINYEVRAPRPSDLKLDRMRALLRLVGDPHRCLRVVHVAGSKGKGSTSALLASVLRQAGYRTGLFTSPHLVDVTERMQVDGVSISPLELTALIEEIRPAVELLEQHGSSPTFFEVATALGLLHFVRRRVDIAVIEVGLGGRFDSTNVCAPLVSVITSISFDHVHVLGDKLSSIAREKAGIVKTGRPVISGATPPEAREVIVEVCRRQGSPLRQLDTDICWSYEPGHVTATTTQMPRVQVTSQRARWASLELGLLGQHQAANAAVAIAVVEELRSAGLHISDQAVANGLRDIDWPARLEVVGRRPLVVLDCAHNVASAQAFVETLEQSFPVGARQLILAVSSDKDVPGIVRVLAPHFGHLHLTRYQGNSRFVAPEALADVVRTVAPVPITVHATASQAWDVARASAAPEDLIGITGSVFLAGELRPLILNANELNSPLRR